MSNLFARRWLASYAEDDTHSLSAQKSHSQANVLCALAVYTTYGILTCGVQGLMVFGYTKYEMMECVMRNVTRR